MIERVRTRARLPERIAAMGGKSMSLVMPELNQKVLSRRDDIIGVPLGAVGISGDISDNDEICALTGTTAARLTAQGH